MVDINTLYSNIPNYKNTQNLYVTPVGSIEQENSWNIVKYNLKPVDYTDYGNCDKYQQWAYKATQLLDPYLLPYYFSQVNVKFIQDSVVNYVKKLRNITIETKQDTNNLLEIMLSNYWSIRHNNTAIINNSKTISPSGNTECLLSNILSNLNKITIEQYIKNVLSTLNVSEYYMKAISTLPMPLSNPTYISNKGQNELGFIGYFEDNHKFTNNLSSFNSKDLVPCTPPKTNI